MTKRGALRFDLFSNLRRRPSAAVASGITAVTVAAVVAALSVGAYQASPAPDARELHRRWRQERVTNIDPPLVRHRDLRNYLAQLKSRGVPVAAVGRSLADREIYQMEFGRGPLKVLMWSQMHGDEPTATSALVDLFDYLHRRRGEGWVKAIEEKITLRAVPMLNPDGAELYQRRNLQSIDINRDARSLVTPEGRLLKKLRDDWRPDVGFNLHNQNSRTAVGATGKQATISLLAVASDEARTDTPGRVRNKKLCAVMIDALAPFIAGHVGRYDDSYNPRAFGDLISQWGTPVILIETGAHKGMSGGDLVGLNFVALASALRALADNSFERADPGRYDALPENASGRIYDVLVRRAHVINQSQRSDGGTGVTPYAADIAVNAEMRRVENSYRAVRGTVQDVGDLGGFVGLDEVDAAGYYVVAPRGGAVRVGAEATLLFYRRDRAKGIDWQAADLETRFPPEAIYKSGAWVKKGDLPIK